MDNGTPNEPEQPSIDWVSYHESKSQDIDVNSVVALVRRVGGELASIDDKKVDQNFKPALQIDKAKLINELQQASPHKPPPVNSPPVVVADNAPPTKVIKQEVKPPQSYSQHVVKSNSDDISKIESRLKRLESATKAFRSAKKIKKGVVYNVSSNSMKGQLKDASLLAEFVMSELAKGVKTITIKLHESSDT